MSGLSSGDYDLRTFSPSCSTGSGSCSEDGDSTDGEACQESISRRKTQFVTNLFQVLNGETVSFYSDSRQAQCIFKMNFKNTRFNFRILPDDGLKWKKITSFSCPDMIQMKSLFKKHGALGVSEMVDENTSDTSEPLKEATLSKLKLLTSEEQQMGSYLVSIYGADNILNGANKGLGHPVIGHLQDLGSYRVASLNRILRARTNEEIIQCRNAKPPGKLLEGLSVEQLLEYKQMLTPFGGEGINVCTLLEKLREYDFKLEDVEALTPNLQVMQNRELLGKISGLAALFISDPQD
jgi:hypothetical protein